jgi:serine-type D-Ala-D-Ala carboxypeptidase (penicillin-binding protein 5/6)
VRPIRTAVAAVAALLCLLAVGSVGPASAAPTPVATPTPEPPLPGQGPGGVAMGGPRMASRGVVPPTGSHPLPKDISAHGWVVADLDTGEILGARNPHGRYPPASTQKWLTALTLLPHLDKHTRVVAARADVDVDGTRVGLVERGHYSVDLLFQAMLMASGNDAANALARVAGSVPSTVAAMNATAHSIGAYDTHAATPSGLDGPRQLTSAYDLALIARADLARADFRRYTAQKLGTIPAQGAKYHAFQFANDNKLLWNYPGAFGGKNGFTDAAHHSFIGAAKHGNRRLIVTMMYGEHKPDNIAAQAGRLLDWGFALRGAAPVGTLAVEPAPSASPTPSASPSASPAPQAITAGGGGSSTPAVAMLAAAAIAALLLGWLARTLHRRRT